MATKKTIAPAGEPVKVRILVDCCLGKCNDVVEVDGAQLAGLDGIVDADPEAVAYAQSLQKE